MIVTRLQGGLGNQMFQYTFGLNIALFKDQPLYLDESCFTQPHDESFNTPRTYSLDCFELEAKRWDPQMNHIFFPYGSLKSRIAHQFKRRIGSNALLYERKLGYDDKIVQHAKANTYAVGYWQSALYFQSISYAVKQAFSFNLLPESIFQHQIISSEQTIAIHIRRGDYVTNANVHKQHGVLPLEYYSRACEAMNIRLTGTKKWFVFSDDLLWCKQKLYWLTNAIFCDTTSFPHWYDMYLMTQCHHHIIANSSYSWWGAWLAEHTDKQVIAPMQWFAHTNSIQLKMHPTNWTVL